MKVVLAAGVVTGVVAGVETSEADGADGEAVPAEAVPTGTRVVLLETGYGATATALLSGTTGAAGPVLRMTARAEELATTTGAEETTGVTIGATGVEETATGVALVATTGCVKVQGQLDYQFAVSTACLRPCMRPALRRVPRVMSPDSRSRSKEKKVTGKIRTR